MTYGEERFADELKPNSAYGFRSGPSGKYLQRGGSGKRQILSQRGWLTFIRNHAEAVAACDLFAVDAVTFSTQYVFVTIEVEHDGFSITT